MSIVQNEVANYAKMSIATMVELVRKGNVNALMVIVAAHVKKKVGCTENKRINGGQGDCCSFKVAT